MKSDFVSCWLVKSFFSLFAERNFSAMKISGSCQPLQQFNIALIYMLMNGPCGNGILVYTYCPCLHFPVFFCSSVLGLNEFISTMKKGRICGDVGNNSCLSGMARNGPWKTGWGYFPLPGSTTWKEEQENHEHLLIDDEVNCEATGFLTLLPSSRR